MIDRKAKAAELHSNRYTCSQAVACAFCDRNMEDPAEWNEDDIELLQEIERRFKEKNSTVMCRELKGIGTGIVLRPCRGCVEDAAEILEEILEERS